MRNLFDRELQKLYLKVDYSRRIPICKVLHSDYFQHYAEQDYFFQNLYNININML